MTLVRQMQTGELNFDTEKCKQCGMCIQLCPGGCLLTETTRKIDILSGKAKGGKYGVPACGNDEQRRDPVRRLLRLRRGLPARRHIDKAAISIPGIITKGSRRRSNLKYPEEILSNRRVIGNTYIECRTRMRIT